MNWTEIRRYQGSWGDWYVQVQTQYGIYEFHFGAVVDEDLLNELASNVEPPPPPPDPVDGFIEGYTNLFGGV